MVQTRTPTDPMRLTPSSACAPFAISFPRQAIQGPLRSNGLYHWQPQRHYGLGGHSIRISCERRSS